MQDKGSGRDWRMKTDFRCKQAETGLNHLPPLPHCVNLHVLNVAPVDPWPRRSSLLILIPCIITFDLISKIFDSAINCLKSFSIDKLITYQSNYWSRCQICCYCFWFYKYCKLDVYSIKLFFQYILEQINDGYFERLFQILEFHKQNFYKIFIKP